MRPPRLGLRILGRFLPAEVREEIEGDLLEEYERRRRSRLWFWGQVLSVACCYARETRSKRNGRNLSRREGKGWAVLHDVRRVIRSTIRRPGFALAVVVLLALGIGANATMFQLAESILHRTVAYPSPDRLVRLFQTRAGSRGSLSPPNYFDLREDEDVFSGLAAYWSPSVTLTGEGEAEKLLAATVSHDVFDVLGVAPRLGRGFTAEDDVPGAPLVVVLGHGLFERRFGSDPATVGRDVLLDGQKATVVGVASPDFDFPSAGTELWVPLRLPRERPDRGGIPYRGYRILNVVGRLKDGTSLSAANARMAALFEALATDHPESNREFGIDVVDWNEAEVGALRAPVFLLWGAVLAVLVIVCANVSGLLLARNAARERELVLRLTLGATRGRLFRELFLEGGLFALLASGLGCALAFWAISVLRAVGPAGLPVPAGFGLDLRLLAFIGTVVALALVLVCVPVLFGLRRDTAEVLRQGDRVEGGRSQTGARRALVVAEMALALTLLVTATLFFRSFQALASVDRGYRDQGVYYVSVELPFAKYRDPHRRTAFFDELLLEAGRLPGVQHASLSLGLPLDPRAEFFVTRSPYSVEGAPLPVGGSKPEAALHVVGPDFFQTLGVSILSGRGFLTTDTAVSTPVVVVTRSFAERAWPEQDPLGKRLTHDLVLLPDDASSRVVVGVVSDFRYYALDREAEPQMFVPHAQSPWPSMYLLMRASSDPIALHRTLRSTIARMDGDVPVAALGELSGVTSKAISAPALRARVLTGFAAVAALLAALGLYGVMSFSVSRRTREMGLRVALGAGRRELVALVLAQGLKLSLAGAVLGVAGAAAATRWVSSLLYGISPFDPTSYAVTCLALVAVALFASYLPARRAAAVDPSVSLRAD
jgi:putative ABC transport system permease protein